MTKKSLLKLLAVFGLFLATAFGGYFSYASSELASTLSGRIFLDVERNGEAWYVHPLTLERYFLGRPRDAFDLMRIVGLGISHQNLQLIPVENESKTGDIQLRNRLSGRILLDVERNGEAWYVDPVSLQRYYLGRPEDAFTLMRQFGLGIQHERLQEIADGGVVALYENQDVPFVPQAPFAEWGDLRQQEGCEEASVLMAIAWAEGKTSLSYQYAKEQIIAMSEWQRTNYGAFVDTSAKDTQSRLIRGYLGFEQTELYYHITPRAIRDELAQGNLVLIPVDGKALRNPHFVAGGPQRHMIVVTGFDWASGDFITNEPGTRYGGGYRYSYQTIRDALRDYPSGNYIPIPDDSPSAMIVVKKVYNK